MTIPRRLCDVMLGDWELVIEKDGDHYAATVAAVFASVDSYRSVLSETIERAIDGACTFVQEQSGPEVAQALKHAATVVIQENLKGDE